MNFEESILFQNLFARDPRVNMVLPPLEPESNLRKYIRLVRSTENAGLAHRSISVGLSQLQETGRPADEQRIFEDGAFEAACQLFQHLS
jgi:hypothetical protein